MGKILITPRPFHEKGSYIISDLRAKGHEVVVNDTGKRFTKDQLLQLVEDVDAILTGNDPIDEEVLSKAKQLKVVSKYGVGLDNIDTKYCERHGITVCKALGANSISVSESAMMLILTSLRKYYQLCHNSKNDLDKRIIGSEANGKTLGILGLGAIGKNVAQYAHAFHMEIIGYDPYVSQDQVEPYITMKSFEDVIQEADILTLHLPLLENTHEIINAETIRKMKDKAILVNTARGGLIEATSLLHALKDGKLSFVSEDVELKERPKELIQMENYNITPHAASFTIEADKNTMNIAVQNILKILEG